MAKGCPLLLTLAFLAGAATAQTGPYGFQDFAFPNPTTKGSPVLPATIYYPATSTGWKTPIVTLAGGHPVLVFLHGRGLLGYNYNVLAEYLSRSGYVVVLLDTARNDPQLQIDDGRAIYPALQIANGTQGHFFFGALDMARVGVFGHSMGGHGAFNAVMDVVNPGYVVALGLAPSYPGPLVMPLVKIPFGILFGEGDPVNPWQPNGLRTYNAGHNFSDLKFFYLFDESCDHHSLVGLRLTPANRPIWERSAQVMTGFFDRFLRDRYDALEQFVGPTARAEPRLSQIDVQVASPDLWAYGSGRLGSENRIEVLCEPGPAAVFTAAGTGVYSTPFGTLELDPTTLLAVAHGSGTTERLYTWNLVIPNQPALVGQKIPLQGIGTDNLGNLELTNLTEIAVER